MYPPCQSTMARAREEARCMVMAKAPRSRAAPTLFFFISAVSLRKSPVIFSSITRVLMVLAPVIPSLKSPVILLFSSRIQLPDLPVGVNQLCLEQGKQQGDQGQDHHHQQRQPGIDGQHHRQGAHQIADVPHGVHQGPGDQGADPARVAHHPGMDVSHAVLVEVAEAQGLQMVEGRAPQIPVDADLRLHGPLAGDVVHPRREYNGKQGKSDVHRQGIQGFQGDEMIQGIPLQQGQQDKGLEGIPHGIDRIFHFRALAAIRGYGLIKTEFGLYR